LPVSGLRPAARGGTGSALGLARGGEAAPAGGGAEDAAGRRGHPRSAYEAPRAAVDRSTRFIGAESKRRGCPRLPARQSRVTLLVTAAPPRSRDTTSGACAGFHPSLGVVEDDAEARALAGGHPADAVAHGRAVGAARARHRPVAVREDDRLAALEDDDLAARLGPRPLLDEQNLAARVVRAPAREHARHLQRKGERAVEILVQAVVAAGRVAEEERGGPRLPGGRAAREIRAQLGRKAL